MWQRIVELVRFLWTLSVRLARVLWACRISIISAGLGVLLFWQAIPAQDIFADTAWNASPLGTLAHWSAVFLALFLVWAFPVHYGARRTLQEKSWLISAGVRRKIEHECGSQCLENVLATMYDDHRWPIKWVPRILGIIPFFAFGLGILIALLTQWDARGLLESESTLTQLRSLLVANFVVAFLFWLFVVRRRAVVARIRAHLQASQRRPLRAMSAILDHLPWLSLILTLAMFLLAYFFPLEGAKQFERALLIPFLFGSLVLALSWVQRLSNRWGVPLIAILVAMCLGLTGLNWHFNDIRTLAPIANEVTQRQIDFEEAVKQWKSANDCATAGATCPPAVVIAIDGGASRAAFAAATFVGEILDRMPDAPGRSRPERARRIFAISSVSGGSLGAVVIRAALADAMRDPTGAPPCRHSFRTWFHDEHFKKPGTFTWRECLQALVTGDYLSPVFIGLGFRDNLAPPKYLFSGPSSIEDRAALLEETFERHYDAVVGNRHASTNAEPAKAGGEEGLRRRLGYLPLLYAQTGEDRSWLPLLLVNSTSVQTGRRIVATDLSSTIKTDRGPVALYSQAYDLFEAMSSRCLDPGPRMRSCQLSKASVPPAGLTLDAPDIALSTAAVTSARFPIASPAGAFTIKDKSDQGDRLVDGGYFENSGVSSALEVVQALRDHATGIHPIILSISNDPEQRVKNVVVPRRPAVTPSVGAANDTYFARVLGILSAPIETLLNTREGHGAEARDLAAQTMASETAYSSGAFYKLGISAQPDLRYDTSANPRDMQLCEKIWTPTKINVSRLSLSWWLSSSVQAEIDAQACERANRATLSALMEILSKEP
jgi:hypothetical protein